MHESWPNVINEIGGSKEESSWVDENPHRACKRLRKQGLDPRDPSSWIGLDKRGLASRGAANPDPARSKQIRAQGLLNANFMLLIESLPKLNDRKLTFIDIRAMSQYLGISLIGKEKAKSKIKQLGERAKTEFLFVLIGNVERIPYIIRQCGPNTGRRRSVIACSHSVDFDKRHRIPQQEWLSRGADIRCGCSSSGVDCGVNTITLPLTAPLKGSRASIIESGAY